MARLVEALVPEMASLWRAGVVAAVALAAIVIEAAPVGVAPTALPSPDLVLAVAAVAAVRRPDCMLIPMVFAVGLTRDLVTDVPTGLGALALVLAVEVVRARAAVLARGSLWGEWLFFAAVALGVAALQYLGTLIMLAQPPYVMAVVRQWVLTVACWPLALLVMRWAAGIRHTPPAKGTPHGQ
ncbi:MAG: hypothetical protein AAFV86_13390 [Pseudomonadota bacterium]